MPYHLVLLNYHFRAGVHLLDEVTKLVLLSLSDALIDGDELQELLAIVWARLNEFTDLELGHFLEGLYEQLWELAEDLWELQEGPSRVRVLTKALDNYPKEFILVLIRISVRIHEELQVE